jgi:hypothetical protein
MKILKKEQRASAIPSQREGVGRGLAGMQWRINPSLPLHGRPHPSRGEGIAVISLLPFCGLYSQEGNLTCIFEK